MKIRKFVAASMRDALAEVKRELGPDAMIVATRDVRRGLIGSGVEVTAAVDVDEPGTTMSGPEAAPAPRGNLNDVDVERIMNPLRSELRSIRSLLRPLAEGRPDDLLRQELAAMRQALSGLGAPRETEPPLADVAAQNVLATPSAGRLVAVVGPTGVGKTTTIAKLAARTALVEHRRAAIVSLDSFRIGGEEQIRAYADLIGVPLTLCSDADRLADAVASHRDAERIYIDTAGRSPHDRAALLELERALGSLPDVEVHLALPAGASTATIDGAFTRYGRVPIDRLMFTKVDEAETLAELVRAPARLGRSVAHITTGQRVPEDLEDATGERLLALARGGFQAAEVAA